MDEHELYRLGFCVTRDFNVTFECVARNELKYISLDKLPLVVVVNTSDRKFKQSSPMHWVAFLVWKRNKVEYYDSLGISYKAYGIFPHFSVTSQRLKQTQSNFSSTCGYFCLYYIYKRLLGTSASVLYEHVFDSTNLEENERLVHLFSLYINRKCKIPLPGQKSFLCASPACKVKENVLQ